MKIEEGRITILVSEEGTTIEIKDNKASITFCKVTLTPKQLSQALSRLSKTKCEIEVFGLDKIGKTHENETFQFEIPKELRSSTKLKELTELCVKSLDELDMSEWKPDRYFASQNTFMEKDGKTYATAVIRRWV
jgi:hypothetical protein